MTKWYDKNQQVHFQLQKNLRRYKWSKVEIKHAHQPDWDRWCQRADWCMRHHSQYHPGNSPHTWKQNTTKQFNKYLILVIHLYIHHGKVLLVKETFSVCLIELTVRPEYRPGRQRVCSAWRRWRGVWPGTWAPDLCLLESCSPSAAPQPTSLQPERRQPFIALFRVWFQKTLLEKAMCS